MGLIVLLGERSNGDQSYDSGRKFSFRICFCSFLKPETNKLATVNVIARHALHAQFENDCIYDCSLNRRHPAYDHVDPVRKRRQSALFCAPAILHASIIPTAKSRIIVAAPIASATSRLRGRCVRARSANTRCAARGPPRRLPPGGASSFWDRSMCSRSPHRMRGAQHTRPESSVPRVRVESFTMHT